MQAICTDSRSSTKHLKQQNTFTIRDTEIEPGQMKAEHILTPQELGERLKVDVSWVYEQTRKRAGIRKAELLPHIRMGKYLRFYWPEIEKWLERRQANEKPASLGGQRNA